MKVKIAYFAPSREIIVRDAKFLLANVPGPKLSVIELKNLRGFRWVQITELADVLHKHPYDLLEAFMLLSSLGKCNKITCLYENGYSCIGVVEPVAGELHFSSVDSECVPVPKLKWPTVFVPVRRFAVNVVAAHLAGAVEAVRSTTAEYPISLVGEGGNEVPMPKIIFL